ncbi:MAG: hypothetical protein WHT07_12575 [Desulfobaccales bacterium]
MAGKRTRLWLVLVLWCLSAGTGVALAGFVGNNDREVQAAVEPLMDNLLAGYNHGDYRTYSRDFDDTLKEAMPERKFRETRESLLKKLGPWQSRQYLGYLNQNHYTVILWKGRFAGTPDDVLIRLVASRRGERVVVTGLWFQ